MTALRLIATPTVVNSARNTPGPRSISHGVICEDDILVESLEPVRRDLLLGGRKSARMRIGPLCAIGRMSLFLLRRPRCVSRM